MFIYDIKVSLGSVPNSSRPLKGAGLLGDLL